MITTCLYKLIETSDELWTVFSRLPCAPFTEFEICLVHAPHSINPLFEWKVTGFGLVGITQIVDMVWRVKGSEFLSTLEKVTNNVDKVTE